MEKRFSELTRRIRRGMIVKSLIFGVSAGVLIAAAVALAQKLMTQVPDVGWIIGIGLGVMLLGSTLMLLLQRPTEKNIAKRLDERLTLGEKVQTMLAFRGTNGTMLDIQRENTEEILRGTSPKSLRSRCTWAHLVLPVIACALALTAVLVPIRTAGVGPTDGDLEKPEPWELTEWHIISVRALIDKVKASDMVEPTRADVVSRLEGLLVSLETVTTKDQMKKTVLDVMVRIDAQVDAVNTYTALIRGLRAATETTVTTFAEALGTPADPILESKYQAFRSSFKAASMQDDVREFASALTTAINSAAVDPADALYASLGDFAKSLEEFATAWNDAASEDERNAELTRLFEASAETMSLALQQQNTNRRVSDETILELSKIFDIPMSEWPEALTAPDNEEAGGNQDEVEPPDDDEDEIISGGGLGSGEVNYGSDDSVYDPEKNSHVKYGEVIDRYDGQKTAELQDRPLSDEIREWVSKYFADLYYNDEND